MGEGKLLIVVSFSPQFFSEPTPPDCELHKCFSVFFFVLISHKMALSGLKVDFPFPMRKPGSWLELGMSLSPDQLSSDKTPAGLTVSF